MEYEKYSTDSDALISFFDSITDLVESVKESLSVFVEEWGATERIICCCIENQWIIYNNISIETIIVMDKKDSDINEIMLDYYKKDNYSNFNRLFLLYKKHTKLSPHELTFSQAYECFMQGNYDIIVYSLFAILDGIFTKVTNNYTYKLDKRLNSIRSTPRKQVLDANDISFALFLATLDALKSIDDYYAFDKDPEPTKLNRHWIMHGRSQKKFTEIDCLKLFNFVFSLLYVNDLNTI